MVYPTLISLNAADHTYLRGQDAQGHSYLWMCFGESADGEELANTRSDGGVDLTVVDFMASQAPCKWPYIRYLSVGVCHQCANRGLYYTGKTVSNARGYNFFAGIYGTYGEDPEGEYSMEACLAAAPDWQGVDYLSPDPGDQADEAQLADAYYRPIGGRSSSMVSRPFASWRAYLDTLMVSKIRTYLGADFPEQVQSSLQAARNRCLDEKQGLDQWVLDSAADNNRIRQAYEALFNVLADDYKNILTPDEYEALFDLSYDEPIDISQFIP